MFKRNSPSKKDVQKVELRDFAGVNTKTYSLRYKC